MVITTPIIVLTLIIAAIVIILGFVFKKKSETISFLVLAGGVMLVILGINLMSERIAFKTGTVTNITLDMTNNTIETEEFVFTEDNTFTSQALKITILLMGLATIIAFLFIRREEKFEEEEEIDLGFLKKITMALTEEEQRIKLKKFFHDNKQYQAEFILNPDIQSEANYEHLDKNLAITNLRHNKKQGIDEPERARGILKALHVLNNPKYFEEIEKEELIGYHKETGKPVYQPKKILVSLFPTVYHNLQSEFISMVNTSAATNGHRMKAAITNRLEKEDSLTEKTNVKPRGFFGMGRR